MRRTVVLASFVAVVSLGAAELKIAVIDFHRAFISYKRRDELQKALTEKADKVREELSKLEEKLKRLTSDIESLEPGSDKYGELNLELVEIRTRIEVTKRQSEVTVKRWRIEQIQALLKELEGVIHSYAEEKKIDLVLTKFWADPELGVPHHVVLYARPALDITDEIIERLNRKVAK